MAFLFEIYLSLLRILLLLLGVMLATFLGGEALTHINDFLVNQAGLPCLEIFSFLALTIIPFAILYGAHAQKYFWQRRSHYNLVILLVCLAVGIILTLFPLDATLMVTPSMGGSSALSTAACAATNTNWFTHALGTALIAVFFGFIGMDIGVSLKHASRKMQTNPLRTNASSSRKNTSPRKKRKK